jgi:hypothetical protein
MAQLLGRIAQFWNYEFPIQVKTHTGEFLSLKVRTNDNIKYIKSMISVKEGIPWN